jgi:hypothetical protein
MRATALNAADDQSRALTVSTSVGDLDGQWMGSSPVRAGDELDLELELGPPRAWDELVGPGTRTDPSPRVPALVEQAFDDGVIVVRIGTTVAQLEIVGEVPASVAGLNVSVPISDLKFFPTGA